MNPTMTMRHLQISLHPGSTVPCNLSWQIENGYLQLNSWGEQGDSFTLGLWGPGDVVIPSLMTCAPLRLLALSAASIHEVSPNTEAREAFLLQHSQQIATLLKLSRMRPAEARLFHLLTWMGQRFGRVSRRGVSLCFEDMNLTHRSLAEIAGLTRVTVTKAISQFRQAGALVREGDEEWLLPEAWLRSQP